VWWLIPTLQNVLNPTVAAIDSRRGFSEAERFYNKPIRLTCQQNYLNPTSAIAIVLSSLVMALFNDGLIDVDLSIVEEWWTVCLHRISVLGKGFEINRSKVQI